MELETGTSETLCDSVRPHRRQPTRLLPLSMRFSRQEYWSGCHCNIQKTKIMASGPINSWQIDRETMEPMIDFILGGSKITADGDCSHEIKRCVLLGRKAMTNLDSILWRRKWQLTPVLLPGKSHGWRSLVGCSPWGR